MIQELRQLLREDSPVPFGAMTLTIIGLADLIAGLAEEHRQGLLAEGALHEMTVTQLVDSFIMIDIAETTNALSVIAEVIDNELLVARIRRELGTRRQPVHPALSSFGGVAVTDAYLLAERSGSGDDVLLVARWPAGTQATLIVAIDNTLGGAVIDLILDLKDDPGRFSEMSETVLGEGVSLQRIDLADAAATVRVAVDAWLEEQPEGVGSETWPEMIEFIEFILVRMPTGGVDVGSYERWADSWHDGETDHDSDGGDETALAHDFLESDEVGDLDDELDHELAHVIAAFAMIDLEDPLAWDPFVVERALLAGLPPMLSGDPEEYARCPELLRAFVRYAHGLRGLPAAATLRTVEEIDRLEKGFQATRTAPQMIWLRAAKRDSLLRDEMLWISESRKRQLIDQVGSEEAFAALTDTPLPDEGLDLTGVPKDVQERVRATAELTDRVADELFGDIEVRTACRRLLNIAAREDPQIFRRRSRDDTAAAAVVWMIGQGNQIFGPRGGYTVSHMMDSLGQSGSPSHRAQPFLAALGVPRTKRYGAEILGRPDLLTSHARREIIRTRDLLRETENL